MPAMSEDERDIAEVYIERMAQMQTLFRFAQLLISSILARVSDLDLDDISHIDIG
jgi:hypothetical protein